MRNYGDILLKTCNICKNKPKIAIKEGGKKFYLCDSFNETHIAYIKEESLEQAIKKRLNSKMAGGIVFLLIIQLILFVINLFRGFSRALIFFLYLLLLLIAIISISIYGNYKYKLVKGLKLLEKHITSPPPDTLVEPTEETIFCPECGFESKKTNKFCGKCGVKLED